MTDTPERIWAFYSDIFGAMWTPTEDAGAHEYIRADLAPTDAQVMAHPKVKALVEAAKPYISPVQTADYGRQLRQYEALCAALRDLEGGNG